MPAPIPDLSRDQQCHHYQAPTGQRCGSPALKGEYYCYHHIVKNANRRSRTFLIDPEITRMEIPVIEDRASIFVALAAVIHRLADNTIDTRRAGQMIYGLQVAMRALEPPPSQRCRTTHTAQSVSETQPTAESPRSTGCAPTTSCQNPAVQPATDKLQPATRTIPITKESLLYFLRSRHCYNCNTELFPAEELTERPHPGAPAEIIEEARRALPAQETSPAILPTLNAVASEPCRKTSNLEPGISNLAASILAGCPIHDSPTVMGGEPLPRSTFAARFALHSPRRSVSLRLGLWALCIPASSSVRPHRILNQ